MLVLLATVRWSPQGAVLNILYMKDNTKLTEKNIGKLTTALTIMELKGAFGS